MKDFESELLKACSFLFSEKIVAYIKSAILVNQDSLEFFEFSIVKEKLEVPSILPKNQKKDGFVIFDFDGDEIGKYYTKSSAIKECMRLIFNAVFRYYEDKEQEEGLAEFFQT